MELSKEIIQEVKKKAGRPKGSKDKKERFRKIEEMCYLCRISFQDAWVVTVLSEPSTSLRQKADIIMEKYPEPKVNKEAVSNHNKGQHWLKRFLEPGRVQDTDRLEITKLIKQKGMEQLQHKDYKISPKLMLDAMRLEQGEDELQLKRAKVGAQIGLQSQLLQLAMYGKSDQLPQGQDIIESDETDTTTETIPDWREWGP